MDPVEQTINDNNYPNIPITYQKAILSFALLVYRY